MLSWQPVVYWTVVSSLQSTKFSSLSALNHWFWQFHAPFFSVNDFNRLRELITDQLYSIILINWIIETLFILINQHVIVFQKNACKFAGWMVLVTMWNYAKMMCSLTPQSLAQTWPIGSVVAYMKRAPGQAEIWNPKYYSCPQNPLEPEKRCRTLCDKTHVQSARICACPMKCLFFFYFIGVICG